MKKTSLFLIILATISLLAAGIFKLLGGDYHTSQGMLFASGYMLLPLIAVVITQLVCHEPMLKGLGIRWKVNRWWFVGWLLMPALIVLMVATAALLPGGGLSMENEMMQAAVASMASSSAGQLPATPTMFLLLTAVSGMLAGTTVNALFAFGEEVAWRGFLLKQFEGKSLLSTSLFIGTAWGLWHAPIILMGHNYPDHPVVGVLMMVLFCISYSPIITYVSRKAKSVIVAAIMHGTFNALAGTVSLLAAGSNDLVYTACGAAGIIACTLVSILLIIIDRRSTQHDHQS